MKAVIRLAHRQVINRNSQGEFEKNVFNDSFSEFLMQSQAYNPDGSWVTMEQLVENNPKANSLHYKVGFAIGLYVNGLQGIIPGLADSLGRVATPFEIHRFEVVRSNIRDKSQHEVAITYESGRMTLLGIVGNYLLLTREVLSPGEVTPVDSFMLQMQPNLSIINYETLLTREALADQV